MAERKRKVYAAFAGYHNHKKLVAGVAMSEDGDVLAGVVIPLKDAKIELPREMGVGTVKLHEYYITRYGVERFEVEFTWEPGTHIGFQRAQQILIDCHPDYIYDPWKPKPFWADTSKLFRMEKTDDVASPEELERLREAGTVTRRRFLN